MKAARTIIYFVIALPAVWIAAYLATLTNAPAFNGLARLIEAAGGVPCAIGIAASLQRQETLLIITLVGIVLWRFPNTSAIILPVLGLALGAGVGALIRRIAQESHEEPLPVPEVASHERK